jgi:uncharacterized membrane protein
MAERIPENRAPAEKRSPEQIRASIEANRSELAVSVTKLRDEVTKIADWRSHLARHRNQIIVGAAVAGFVLGGGLAAIGGIARRRR